MSTRIAVALAAAIGTAAAQPAPPPAPPASTPPPPAPPTPEAPPPQPEARQDRRLQLDKEVEDFDWQENQVRRVNAPVERARGFFIGASLAYATMAKLEVTTDRMSGTVEFPTVFGAEVQAGYRLHRSLSVALASQMFFNLQPHEEDPARELSVFAQATGHLVLAPQWDLGAFVAPGYSVLLVPGSDDARGLAFRWGGGPMFHLTPHVSFAAELGHQLGFQKNGGVDMQTSFFSLFAGVRFRR